jgi:type I restriction enzyme M protein
MKDRVLRDFDHEKDILRIANTFHAWKKGEGYEDVAGFCKSVALGEMRKHGHVLTPGRYMGAAAQEDDGEPFGEKMERLTLQLSEQFFRYKELEEKIKENLKRIGYEL